MKSLTDFHTHILPGIDDGSPSLEESLKMLRGEAAQGVKHVVLTPHFYPHLHSVSDFLSRRAEAYEKLCKAVAGEDGLPQLHLGAEVYYYNGISCSDALQQLALEGTKYLLVEMPGSPWPGSAYEELETIIQKRKLTPIIAHIDRYIRPLCSYGIWQRLEDIPVRIQANAEFFQKRATRSMALRLLKNGRIHMLGSDCHSSEYRPPDLTAGLQVIEKKLGKSFVENLCDWDDLLH